MAALAAGLYPFLHYYNGNFDIADTWVQFFFLIGLCLVLPVLLVLVFPFILKFSFLKRVRKTYLAGINFVMFVGLLGLLIFQFDKKIFALVLLGAGLLSFLLYKQLNKIVIIQLLLAVMSLVTLVPRLLFMHNYSSDWTLQPDQITAVKFKQTPNIYVIQPDGYANFSEMRKPPYNNEDKWFENWLLKHDFSNYENFRSNYYSTLTSNASLFAMKHHYYENTYPGNLKTYGSQEVIVGDNAVLQTLKHNNYKTHLLTDNSFFLVNRKLKGYDYCNVPQHKVLLYDTGGVKGIDIVSDLEKSLQTQGDEPQFYFIEKTTPSHIMYTTERSLGVEGERTDYLRRLKKAHGWLTSLIQLIEKHDPKAMVVIVADHGGYVGLTSVKEVEKKKLNELETVSVFTSLLSIKWPENNEPTGIEFDTSVNLFRTLFSHLGEAPELLKNKEENGSYLPLYDGMSANYFQVLSDEGVFDYKKIDD